MWGGSELLALADIQLNGPRDFDLKVHDERFYERVLRDGSLGLGESYMDGWWDCEALDEMIFRLFRADVHQKVKITLKLIWQVINWRIGNRQRKG